MVRIVSHCRVSYDSEVRCGLDFHSSACQLKIVMYICLKLVTIFQNCES
jgi:hypothetical protein